MKKSKRVPLLVIGTVAAAVGGCDSGAPEFSSTPLVQQEVRQEFYTSLADCQRDWGNDPRDCSEAPPKQAATTGGGVSGGGGTTVVHSGGGGYIGPRYYWDRDIGRPVALAPSGETRVLTNSYISRGVASAARSNSVSVVSVARGGFGATAHGISAGG